MTSRKWSGVILGRVGQLAPVPLLQKYSSSPSELLSDPSWLRESSNSLSQAQSASTATFVTALVFNAAVFGIELGIFTLVRPFFPAIYQPRTYIPPKSQRVSSLTQNDKTHILLWPYRVFWSDYEEIRTKNGMDAYFFVRFLRMFARILLPIWLISWIVLLPVTSVGTNVAPHTGLDRFIFGNVAPNKQSRYAAHLILTWFFTVWIWYNIRLEMKNFVTVRQKWLIDPKNASSPRASTILITGVPRRYLSESAIAQLFSHLPGGVAKVWLNRDLKEMPELYDRRQSAAKKLESAETNLLNTAVKLHNKKLKAEAKQAKKSGSNKRASVDTNRPLTDPTSPASTTDVERDVSLAEKLVPRNKRPTHRLPPFGWLPFSLPLIGQKVDSIEWARQELETTNAALRIARRTLARDVALSSSLPAAETNHPDAMKTDSGLSQTYPPLNSAFVLFNSQIAAHMAAQVLTHHMPYRMASKSVNVAPEDVVWSNLNMNPYEARVRSAISWAITIGLVIVWAIPVAFIGIVSNVHSLCATYSWLSWLCDLPSVIVGIISGILPPVLLAVLMMLLPIILRLLARFEGMTQKTSIELSLMTRYFIFLVINSFLVVTLSAGIIAALPQLVDNPASIPTLLAQELPKASNFFLTYIILQGLSGTASGFLQVVPLVLYYVKLFILGSTPRSIYAIKYTLRSVSWGTLFPSVTLLVVITLAYSVISPIINGLSFVTFFLFFQLWKYLFLWQVDGSAGGETGGLFFPKAINHLFVGLYLQQICLAALFFLAEDENKKASAIPEGALMIVLIAFTAFFHLIINNSYGPLIEYLPLTLADVTHKSGREQNAIEQEIEDGDSYDAEAVEAKGDANAMQKRTARKRVSGDSQQSGRDDADKTKVRDTDVEAGEPTSPSSVSPTRTDKDKESNDSSVRGVDEDAGPKDFYHPASVEPAPIIWIPRDPLGLGEAEERACKEAGLAVSTQDAVMDAKGHVDISGPPPGSASWH
ncbi:hypothetical protein DICSQDRAFT_183264 [Dichomitus squalens LYAD-421 SS1]|uniref:DUF221-domain-containing protein n=1 Tax=Dichomitus squalens (strain LYAD-421) TaxID=732165 RepID=R7SN99_DICSQ|nr:uncharacterized protein DICSQDRAFT_183264 [Dichomitus squalens LYAD-421 SS1]EJF57403.1 hypothetical protein DICSQDRAFT_183264 [Dichomitus squalens LYAD-421 SS1]